MRIAIDAMGGDYAPEEIVKGVMESAREMPRNDYVLVGDQHKIEKIMGRGRFPSVDILHTDEFITMDDPPNTALKAKKKASMRLAAQLVKDGDCESMISAGNTGALMETSLLTIGRIKGIKRPALGVFLPNRKRYCLLIDAGANADCRPDYLIQFARMGSLYMEHVGGIYRPRVGLLNIGEEPGKGSVFYRQIYDELANLSDINFVGNTESRAMMHGDVDVAVADGFVGNMVLKSAEAAAEFMLAILRDEIKKSVVAKVAALTMKPVFRNIKKRLDHSEVGGALLLGLNGILVKSHGRADARTIYSAVRMLEKAHQQNLQEFIKTMALNEPERKKERTEIEKLSI
jgi:glycerol-3-phosphate acyltransferase PlsX